MIDTDYQLNDAPHPEDFPWPPPEHLSVLDALAATWKESVFQPASFFARMPRAGNFGWALLYYLLIGIVAAGISLFWYMLLGPSLIDRLLMTEAAEGNPFLDFLLSPVIMLIGLYVIAGALHVLLLILRAANHPYGTTLRVICYSGGPQLFGVVPYVGPVLGGIWSLAITIIGLREAHQTTTRKAALVLLIPLFLFAFIVALAIIAAALLRVSLPVR